MVLHCFWVWRLNSAPARLLILGSHPWCETKNWTRFSLSVILARDGDIEENYVSSATVYRTLREFVDAGLLKCFQLDGRTVYDFDYGYPQHDHLYCTVCRKLIEFQSDALMSIRDEVAAEKEFRVSGHGMIIQGICKNCGKLKRKKRKQDLV